MPQQFIPHEQKRLMGNPGKRKLPTPVEHQAPVTLAQATQTPTEALESVLSAGHPWLGSSDSPALALLHEWLEERAEIKQLLAEGSDAVKRKDLRDLDALIAKMLSQLGLDSVSRSKLGLSEVKAASSLDKMRQRARNHIEVPESTEQ